MAKEVVMDQATNTVISTEERRRHLEAAKRRPQPSGLPEQPKPPLSNLMSEIMSEMDLTSSEDPSLSGA